MTTTFVPEQQIRVNIEFINAKCNDVGFVFYNYKNEFRTANVIDVVYNLILNYCEKNIHNPVKEPRSADDLIFLYNGTKINEENIFRDLSPTTKNYTIHVVYLLKGDQRLMEEMELREALGIGYGRKQSRNKKRLLTKKRTNKKRNHTNKNNKNKNRNKK